MANIVDEERLSKSKKNKIVEEIIEEYKKSDVIINEMLETVGIKNISIQDTVDIYARLVHLIEEDKVIVIKENEEYDRNDW